MHARPGQYTSHAKSFINHFHLSFQQKKNASQTSGSKTRSQREGRDAKLVQLRLTGHVSRLFDERLPKTVHYGELQHCG